MLKIVRTVAPTAEMLDIVIGSFFKENGMEYTSTLDYTPCIAGYGEFCEKRDLVYALSETDENRLRGLRTIDYENHIIIPSINMQILKHLHVYAIISAPISWFKHDVHIPVQQIIKSLNAIKSPIISSDFDSDLYDVPSVDTIHRLNIIIDAGKQSASISMLEDFWALIPDNYIVTASVSLSYSDLARRYSDLAYPHPSQYDSDEIKKESKWIFGNWVKGLPCSFLINPDFANNCVATCNVNKEKEDDQNERNMD